MSEEIVVPLPDSEATQALGARLAPVLAGGGVVFLSGDLGAGKTTLSRALLRAFGHTGPVRSPTYTLVEPYEIAGRDIYHLDLYRIADAGELEFLGLRDWLLSGCLLLVEWPERGSGFLPAPDLHLRLDYDGEGRRATLTGPLARRLGTP